MYDFNQLILIMFTNLITYKCSIIIRNDLKYRTSNEEEDDDDDDDSAAAAAVACRSLH